MFTKLTKRNIRRLLGAIGIAIIVLTLICEITLGAFTYYANILVQETDGNDYDYLPIIADIDNDYLSDNGYISLTGLDTRVLAGSTELEHIVTDDKVLFVAPQVEPNSTGNYKYTLNNTSDLDDFPTIVGHDGYITINNDANLELGSNFAIEQSGYIDTTDGTNKNLVYKEGAYKTYISGANDVTSVIGNNTQPIVGGTIDTLNPAAVEYNCLMGARNWVNAESSVYQVIPTGGEIDGLYIELNGAPGAGDAYTFTLMVNSAPTALEVTISGAADTTGNDWGAIAVAAGDTVSLRSQWVVAPAAVSAIWSTNWLPTIEGESICLTQILSNNIGTRYGEIQGHGSSVAVETQVQAPVPTAGTFKKMYVQLDVDPGNAPDAYSFTLRDAAIDTALTCTIVADDTTGSDTVNTVAVAAGALVDIEITNIAAPANSPHCAIGMVFDSDTDGESLIMGGNDNQTAANSTEYLGICTASSAWTGAEVNAYQLTQSCVLEKLYVSLDAAPGGAETYTVSIREAGADTGLTVTITGAATTGNDAVNIYTSLNGDTVDTRYVSSAAAALTRIHWGLVASNPLAEVTTTVGASDEHTITTYGIPDAELDFVRATSDYVNLPINNSPLDFTSEDFSIVIRGSGDDVAVIDQWWFGCGDYNPGVSGCGYGITARDGGAAYRVEFQTNQSSASQSSRSGYVYTFGTTYTIGVTRQGASCLIYRDGVDVTTTFGVHVDPAPFGIRNPVLGARYSAGVGALANYLDGQLDEVAVFNKQLSDAEMLAIHNMYVAGGTLLPSSDVVGLWRLGENAGVTTYDATDNDIDGTLSGGLPNWVNKDDLLAIADEDSGYIAEDYDTQTGVPGNASDWFLNQNNVMPYMDYYKHTVGGTLIAWYQPISMIIGTNLDDREGTDIGETGTAEEDGIITWGANPAGVDVEVGSLISSSQPTISPASEEEAPDIIPEGAVPSGGTVDTTLLEDNPLYSVVQLINEQTGYTEEQIWFIGATIFILIAMGLAAVKVRNHLMFAGIIGIVFAGFFYAMGIYQWWMLLIFGFMFISSIVMERKPVL